MLDPMVYQTRQGNFKACQIKVFKVHRISKVLETLPKISQGGAPGYARQARTPPS